ncbi:MAG: pentapeptide repeat-containing protein, partial [Alphaproteobacteria bacterium]|nr:pentapeptide repeat-containing protein [Alphaproteobacteria bacterium]
TVKIFGNKKFTHGETYIVFANRRAGGDTLLADGCSPLTDEKTAESGGNQSRIALLKAYADKVRVMDGQLAKTPALSLYMQKIALLEKFRDYERLKTAYAAALGLPADGDRKPVPAGACNDIYARKAGMPDFIETQAPAKAALLASYGRTLFRLGEYDAALRPLCIAETLSKDPESRQWITQILQKQGKVEGTGGEKLDFTGARLEKQVFEGKNFSGVSFRGAKISDVKFINSNLAGADFSNADITGAVTGSDLSGAAFDGAKLRGEVADSKFDGASLKNAEIEISAGGGNSFKKADFSAGKLFIMDCRMAKDWRANDFGDARFADATVSGLARSNVAGADFTRTNFYAEKCISRNEGIDLSGKNFDNTKFDLGDYKSASFRNASLKNATFTGDDLTGADFKGADLTGADFRNASYNGPVKLHGADFTGAKIDGVLWTGANFDCNTKFPAGFRPEEHQMVTKDTTCESPSLKNPGVVKYDREFLGRGYMNVCNGDFHADCIYGFLASYHVQQQNWRYQEELGRLADSLIEAGYPDLARIIALKMMGATALSKHSLDPQYHDVWLALLLKIDNSAGIKTAAVAPEKSAAAVRMRMLQNKNPAEARLSLAQEEAAAGDYKAAVARVKQIGDEDYNNDVLGWGNGNRGGTNYGEQQQGYALAMQVALERHWRGEDMTAEINRLTALMQKKPGNRDEMMMAAAAAMAGLGSSRPDLMVAAYAATGRIDDAWEIYNARQAGNEPGGKLAMLGEIADHYARHPDKDGTKKVLAELKTFAIERWPQQGDMIYVGIESGIHKQIFDILGRLKSASGISGILAVTEGYSNDWLKIPARVYAAGAFAKVGDFGNAWAQIEKTRAAMTAVPPAPAAEGRRAAPKSVIVLAGSSGLPGNKQPAMISDHDYGSALFALAVSGAPQDLRVKALQAGDALLQGGHDASPMFRVQMAVAAAAVLGDKNSGEKIKDAEFGVPAAAVAALLHEAGMHAAEKKMIEVSLLSGDVPPFFGLERLGTRTGMQARGRTNLQSTLAAMYVRDGHFEEATRIANALNTAAPAQTLGGTDYATYFTQQKALYTIAAGAVTQKKPDIAAAIAKDDITYPPYRAAVYFAAARAASGAKMREMYDAGYALTPSFGDAMGTPLTDPDGVVLDALADRAAAEKALGLADRYAQTLSFAKQAAAMAQNDVQRGKTSSAVDRILQLDRGADGAPKQSIEAFISSLNIRDDLNSTSVVKQLAEKYLQAGDAERARAVAMYGLRRIDSYPQASGKVIVLLPYAAIIARTEARMDAPTQKKIEVILREMHANTPGGKEEDVSKDVDFVAEGEIAYKELKRRLALDDAPANEGDLENQYRRDGTFVDDHAGLFQQWQAGATQKYNAAHPAAPVTAPLAQGRPRVITREVTLPSREYGGPFNAWLIVPADVPRPKGRRHSATIFYMSDFTCEGNYAPFCKY